MNCSIFKTENKSGSFEFNKASLTSFDKSSIELQEKSINQPLGTLRVILPKQKNKDKFLEEIEKYNHSLKRKLVKEGLVSNVVSKCGIPLPFVNDMGFSLTSKGSISVKGALSCKSIHECPVCQSSILNEKQEHLEQINKGWLKDHGEGSILLITFTVRHSKNDSFKSILGNSKEKLGINGAYSRLSSHRNFNDIKRKYNHRMSVRGLETTWGLTNGFHSHIHSLFYLEAGLSDIQKEELKKDLYDVWVKVCQSSNVSIPSFKHGIDISNGANAGKYIAKWSSSNELTSLTQKEAKNGNFTISNLNSFLMNPDKSPLPINMVKAVLKEYYLTMKGKKLLTWSDKDKLRSKYISPKTTEIIENVCFSPILFNEMCQKELVIPSKIKFKESFEDFYLFLKDQNINTNSLFCLDSKRIDIDKRIEELKNNYGFFPSLNELDKYFIKFCALNYVKLLDIALINLNDRDYFDYGEYSLFVRKFCYQFDRNLFLEAS